MRQHQPSQAGTLNHDIGHLRRHADGQAEIHEVPGIGRLGSRKGKAPCIALIPQRRIVKRSQHMQRQPSQWHRGHRQRRVHRVILRQGIAYGCQAKRHRAKRQRRDKRHTLI